MDQDVNDRLDDSSADVAPEPDHDVEELLIEEISIDGMCGVY